MTAPIILTASQCKINNIVWDVDWLGEAEIQILMEKFQYCGPFVYQAIVMDVAGRGGFLPISLLRAIAIKTKVDLQTIEAIVEECKALDIIQVSQHGITSRRAQREIEKFMRMKFSKAIAAGSVLVFPWSNLGSTHHAPTIQAPTDGAKDRIGKERLDKDRKGEDRGSAPVEVWNFTGALCGNPQIVEWAPKVREKLHRAGRTFGQFELEAALSTHGLERVIAAMRHTCQLTAPKNLCYPVEVEARAGPKTFEDRDRAKYEAAKAKFLAGEGDA